MSYEFNNNPIDNKFLNCIGFYEKTDPFLGKIWAWGSYTANGSAFESSSATFAKTRYDSPILMWDEKTQIMHAPSIGYKKKINTIEGFNRMINSVNFLMSTES